MNTFILWAIYFFVVIIAYLLWKIYEKINEIIRYLNEKEDGK